jgi:hypothetical protein
MIGHFFVGGMTVGVSNFTSATHGRDTEETLFI